MQTNLIKSLFNQQYGYGVVKTYEPYLSRLYCLPEDDYSQIYPTGYPDTPIFACKFSEKRGHENILALANEDGKIAIHNIQDNKRVGLHAHNNAIFDLTWLFGQLKIVTASGDHSSKLYDISNAGITEDRTFFRHERSVKTITSCREDPSIFSTGGRDGNIIIWDIRADNSNANVIGKSDKIIRQSHVSKVSTPSRGRKTNTIASHNNSVTGLVFQNSNTLISCGAGDGCIKIWDLRKTHFNGKREPVPKFTLPYPGKSARNGFSNLVIDSQYLRLYANCLDNNIYCYNVGTYEMNPIRTYSGHQNNTFYIKSALSVDGSFLISGSSDESAYIWNLKYSEPICKLVGHTAEVTCVAWCHDSEFCIVTCSDDVKHKLWRLGPEEHSADFLLHGKGKAEVLPRHIIECKSSNTKRSKNNIDTPRISKKLIISCEKCSDPTENKKFCDNCDFTKKRKIEGGYEDGLIKRPRNAELGPRQLFTESGRIENVDGEKKRKRDNDTSFSPLKDLPNFVVDGVAPHLKFSPPNKKHCDWLTQLRIDHNFKRKMMEHSEEIDTKILKVELTPKTKVSSSNVKSPAQRSPLLKYFKLTNNSLKCEKHSNVFKACSKCDNFNLFRSMNSRF